MSNRNMKKEKNKIEFIQIEEDGEAFAVCRITPLICNNGVYSNGSYKVRVSLSCCGIGDIKKDKNGLTREELEKVYNFVKLEL